MNKNLRMLLTLIALTMTTMTYQNCGGSFDAVSQLSSTDNGNGSSGTGDWVVNPAPTFTEGSNDVYNLAATLPAGALPNGTFGIDTASGPDLPAGMVLDTATGVIHVASATAGTVNGVVFTYTEP